MLIALSVSGFAATFIWVNYRNIVSSRQVQAQDLAKETLELLLINDYNDANLSLGNHTAESFLNLSGCNFSGQRFYAVDNITEGKNVTVTVAWIEESENKQEQLCGLIIEK